MHYGHIVVLLGMLVTGSLGWCSEQEVFVSELGADFNDYIAVGGDPTESAFADCCCCSGRSCFLKGIPFGPCGSPRSGR